MKTKNKSSEFLFKMGSKSTRLTILFITIIHMLGVVEVKSQSASKQVLPLIPQPQELEIHAGNFIFSPSTVIVLTDSLIAKDAGLFNDYLENLYGYRLKISDIKPENNFIVFNYPDFEAGSKENYHLSISPQQILITAEGNGSGFFYAFQTLSQLIPVPEISAAKTPPKSVFQLPCLEIKDKPAFSWRGMHLDVCRHFMPKDFVKKYIDLLASYKMNTFHWHLTEDQGWRIEIKKYPRLTEIAAWRKGSMVGPYKNQTFDTIKHGGFYTQEEIKEVVAYASARHVTIVPEIELPGHSVAAIAAYPFLSCTGKPIEVQKKWGVFEEVYCPKDSTFQFLEDVLSEIIPLFPGKYIHIGGDECPKESWKKCPDCQQRIKDENLKDEHELQSYFIKRVEKFVNSKGKQIIGWDEILEGGLAPNAAVMSWRGTEGGIAAARQKHYVVMSPGKPCYFDHYQSKNRQAEPHAIGGFNPLDSVYHYNPLRGLNNPEEQAFILGAQGNVWTEYILTPKQVEYMAVPRMLALAEAVWTNRNRRNYKDFIKRLKIHSKVLDRKNINYAKHFQTVQK